MGMRDYRVNIIGLSNKEHHFDFEVGSDFFKTYGSGVVSDGAFKVQVTLDKRETFIEAQFSIQGLAKLICDRSLDPFDHPVKSKKKLVFKYGDTNEELSDEIVMIHRDSDSLELGQYIYEFIALEIPLKKLHPRYAGEPDDDTSEGRIIYTSGESFESGSDDIDPRWEKLKKLK